MSVDPLHAALHALLQPATSGVAATPLPLRRTLTAALRLQQQQRDGKSPAALLYAVAARLLHSLLPATAPAPVDEAHSNDGSSGAHYGAPSGPPHAPVFRALSFDELESLALDAEAGWQLLSSLGYAAPTDAVQEFVMGLFLTLGARSASLHASTQTLLAQVAQVLPVPVARVMLQLLDEFLAVHLPFRTHAGGAPLQHVDVHGHASSAVLLPTASYRELVPSAVLQACSLALSLLAKDDPSVPMLQSLFERRLLPLYQLDAPATSLTSPSGANPVNSLPALLHKHILPFFLSDAYALHGANLRSLASIVLRIDPSILAHGLPSLPMLLSFLVDYFPPLVSLLGSGTDAEGLFNAVLLCAQMGLSGTEDSVRIKQSLHLLVCRAKELYAAQEEEQEKAARKEQQHKGKGAHAAAARSAHRTGATSLAPSSSVSVSAPAVRSSRCCFPDYSHRVWLGYESLFLVLLTSYELHLVKFSFQQLVEPLLEAHERWYAHGGRARSSSSSSSSPPAPQSFTPDIFLELLVRFALRHENPYVRKFVYFTVLLQWKDRVRFSVQLLFLDSPLPQRDSSSEHSSNNTSLLHILSSPALQPFLPSPRAILAFWEGQFRSLGSGAERSAFAQRFLEALAHKAEQVRTTGTHGMANLALHVNFLAHVRSGSGPKGGRGGVGGGDDGEEVYIAPEVLLPCLFSLARAASASSSAIPSSSAPSSGGYGAGNAASAAGLPRSKLLRALAALYGRFMPVPPIQSAPEAQVAYVQNLGRVWSTVVPASMRGRRGEFYKKVAEKVNEGDWLARSLMPLVHRTLLPSGDSLPPPLSIHSAAAELCALLSLLPPSHPTVGHVGEAVFEHVLQHVGGGAGGGGGGFFHGGSVEGAQRGIEVLLGLMKLVGAERDELAAIARTGAAAPQGQPRAHSFEAVMSSLSLAPTHPHPSAAPGSAMSASSHPPAPCLLDALLRHFLDSPNAPSLSSFILAQLLPPVGVNSAASAGISTSSPAQAHLRAMSLALLSRLIRMYPSLPSVRELTGTVLREALGRLLPTTDPAAGAVSQSTLPPLQECAVVQVLSTVMHACYGASKQQHASLSLAQLISPAHYVSLLSFLCSTPLLSKLLQKSLFTPSAAAGAAPSHHYAPEELKSAYFCNSQRSRWELVRLMLRWALREWEGRGGAEGRETELLQGFALARQQQQPHSYGFGDAPSFPPPASSFLASLFALSPRFLLSTLLSSAFDGLEGSTADFWGPVVDVLSVSLSILSLLAQAAGRILSRTAPEQLGSTDAQVVVLQWVQAGKSMDGEVLPGVLAAVWRSFQDVATSSRGAATAGSAPSSSDAEGEEEQPDWPGWVELPRSASEAGLEAEVAPGKSDPSVPAMYTSFVDLLLHPLLFAEKDGSAPSGGGGGAEAAVLTSTTPSPRALVKSYLSLLLPLAQRKGMRSLLYALSLRLVELLALHPLIGVEFLPEVGSLITLDSGLKQDQGSGVGSDGSAAAAVAAAAAADTVVPMEHLIRILFLSLLEHLVQRANSPSSSPHVDAAYSFSAQSLHYFISLNFSHPEYCMSHCGGDNPLDELGREVDELADQEAADGGAQRSDESAAAEARKALGSGTSGSASSSSRVHVAISSIWHALCVLSRLRLRPSHCVLGDASSMKRHRVSAAANVPAASAAAAPGGKKPKSGKGASSSSGAGSSASAMPTPLPLSPNFPLLDFVQSAALVMLVSPAVTSRVRHLVEIFLINYFVANVGAETRGAGSAGAGGFPSLASPPAQHWISLRFLPFLDRTVFRQNISCSLLVVGGFLASFLAGEQFRLNRIRKSGGGVDGGAGAEGESGEEGEYTSMIHTLLSQMHVWSSSPLGQVRTVAQYFFYHLFLEVFHAHLFREGRTILPKGVVIHPGLTAATAAQGQAQAAAPMVVSTDPLPLDAMLPPSSALSRAGALLRVYHPVWVFLWRCAGVALVRQRQDAYFRSFRPLERASVEGIVRYASGGTYVEGKDSAAAEGAEEEEDPEASEATQLTEMPSSAAAASSSSSRPVVADPSNLLSYGTHLSNQDLLLHVRRVANAHLHSLTEEREQSYFDDSNQPPVAAAVAADANAPLASGADVSPSPTDLLATAGAHSLNFQQKIAPVKAQFIEDASSSEIDAEAPAVAASSTSASASGLPPSKHLIICASLVSKPVNLGGLCRTAEIMGARLLVPDARVLSDAIFVGVSSTANRWADIEVVGREELGTYLLAMRAQGYAIVGLEQTKHSTKLQHAHFSDRVVLVLGDEKRGIPAPLLGLLTHVVEIPQFGLIRSLNVHVSAGMIVWEFIKQAVLEQERVQAATAAGGSSASAAPSVHP